MVASRRNHSERLRLCGTHVSDHRNITFIFFFAKYVCNVLECIRMERHQKNH